jgi:hypothetical protein
VPVAGREQVWQELLGAEYDAPPIADGLFRGGSSGRAAKSGKPVPSHPNQSNAAESNMEGHQSNPPISLSRGVAMCFVMQQRRQQRADIDALYELVERVDQKVDAVDVKLVVCPGFS